MVIEKREKKTRDGRKKEMDEWENEETMRDEGRERERERERE